MKYWDSEKIAEELIHKEPFGKESHLNKDISSVPTTEIPNHGLLVGGFPCQEYSVDTTLNNSKI